MESQKAETEGIRIVALDGLILCGGRGQRMGGRDKPLVEFDGRPMVEAVHAVMRHEVQTIWISANRNLDTYARYGQVLTDADGTAGPLAGVLQGLQASQAQWLYVCPGDCPRVPAGLSATLLEQTNSQTQAVVAHDGERAQVLNGLFRVSLAPQLAQHLSDGGYSVIGWLASLAHVEEVHVPSLRTALESINTPQQLR